MICDCRAWSNSWLAPSNCFSTADGGIRDTWLCNGSSSTSTSTTSTTGSRSCFPAATANASANFSSRNNGSGSGGISSSSKLSSVPRRLGTFDPSGDYWMKKIVVRRSSSSSSCACECECVCSSCYCRARAASSSAHLNFHLPSRSFAGSGSGSGSERVLLGGGSVSCEPSDLECKSASNYYNPQFGAERIRKQQNQQQQDTHESPPDLGFSLHDFMDQAGIETTHARVARAGFAQEVAKLRNQAAATDRNGDHLVDVARAALEISAEDDALVSHSSVPLPVDSYLDRLDSMATEFGGHYLRPRSPGVFDALDNYLWNYKGFRRTKARTSGDARDFYLNGVLTRRQGPPVMLGLIYSEVVKRLWKSGKIDFLVDMIIPGDDLSFPRPIYKNPHHLPSKNNVKDHGNSTDQGALESGPGTGHDLKQDLLTPKNILSEILRFLKKLYWPWKPLPGAGSGSDFLEAATAANRGFAQSASSSHGSFESLFNAPSSERGSEVARARAAQYRLQRGIWTSTAFGDLRRALAASERLVMLGGDNREHRDYGMLLFHAGLYNEAFQYLSSYASLEVPTAVPGVFIFNAFEAQVAAKEAVALDHLLDRLSLILTEKSWAVPQDLPPVVSPPDPW